MEFTIRPIKKGDAEGLNALRRLPGTFENIFGIPSERITKSEDFIANLSPDTHMFVAVTKLENGEELILGMAGLGINQTPRLRHSADVGIMVHTDYQGKGVGKALMSALLDVADNWLMLVRVELSVFVDNEKAIQLYEKLGFVKEGIQKYATIRNGKYVDAMIMARINHSLLPHGDDTVSCQMYR